MTRRIAVIGGGISGLSVTYELARAGADVTLFEGSDRLGGTVETVHRDGFVIECGPDGWVSEKPWARDLASELGLADQLVSSRDLGRKTYILRRGRLVAMPEGMQLMVPTDLAALDRSTLFSPAAIGAFHDETRRADALRGGAPTADESVADFVRRHFGQEVLETVAAPLLSGVLGGDVHRLSVRAVLPRLVALERTHGSLILALQQTQRERALSGGDARRRTLATAIAAAPASGIFTTLRGGLGGLTDAIAASIPASAIRLRTPVLAIHRHGFAWSLRLGTHEEQPRSASMAGAREAAFDDVVLATPLNTTRRLLAAVDPRAAHLLPVDASSAIVIAFAWPDSRLSLRDRRRVRREHFGPPPGFGFLVPPRRGLRGAFGPQLLAATFTDQKFPDRVPPGGRLVRVFFGGAAARRLWPCPEGRLAQRAIEELRRVLGPLPAASPLVVARRWPHSLPQYEVGHLDRIAALEGRLRLLPGLHVLGNGLRGVGLPDLIRDGGALARTLLQ